MYMIEDVNHLGEEVANLKLDPPVSVAKHSFDLGLDVHDPVSGQIITVARPARTDIGQAEILLTPHQVFQAVGAARMNALHNARAAGHASLEAAAEARKRDSESRALAARQAAELAALQVTHAEAAAVQAEAAHPRTEKAVETEEQRLAREEEEERNRFAAEQAARHNAQRPGPYSGHPNR